MKNRKRNRIQGFNYSSDNLYFVTICVQDRLCCLGSVISVAGVGTGRDLSVHNPNESHKKMELNRFGKIVHDRIIWLAEQYQYVDVHNFVIMPNHVHAIIEIDSRKLLERTARSERTGRNLFVRDEEIKIKSLSSLIGAFKTTSSKIIHQAGLENFAWQRSFHDHIIRNEKSYLNISNYIDVNPEKWDTDTFFDEL